MLLDRFLSVLEKDVVCLSAITWAGFDNFAYLFPYEATRDDFNIPHDLGILDQVFSCKEGGNRRENAYWTASSIRAMIAALPSDEENKQKEFIARADELGRVYAELSARYQSLKSKGEGTIALA